MGRRNQDWCLQECRHQQKEEEREVGQQARQDAPRRNSQRADGKKKVTTQEEWSKKWEKWDLLQKQIAPIQKRYAAKVLNIAEEIFGPDIYNDPTLSGAVNFRLQPLLAISFEIAMKQGLAKPKKRKSKRAIG
jgi:hypothetical protein